MMNVVRRTRSLGSLVVLAAACTSPPARHPGNRTAVCEAECDRLLACKGGVKDCVERCTWHSDSREVYARPGFVEELSRCLRNAPCEIGRKHSLEDCAKSTRERFAATPAENAYCAKKAQKDAACGRAADVDACVDRERVLVDDVFPALEDCLSKECERYERCILGVFANGPS